MQESLNFLKQKIQENQTIIVACSGGPDSMALLYLTTLIRKKKKINIICAHINHNVREESKNEALFVKEFCQKYKILFEQKTITEYHNDNFHAYTRKIRYDFFKQLYDKYQACYLLTAHHGDDLMETILMRLVRGSTLTGYAGFNIESNINNMTVLRPLIFKTKEEIEKWDKKNNIPYVIDKSNYKDVYTRNRYRKYILPILKEENHLVNKKFEQFSQELFLISSFLDKEAHKYYKQIVKQNKIDISLFLKTDLLIQKEILKLYLLEYYKNDMEKITSKHINILINVINNKKVNDNIIFPNKMIVVKDNNYVYLTKNINNKLERQELKIPFILENKHVIKNIEKSEEDGNDICRLNSKEISLPLYIRKRKPGDKMLVKNMKGHKNINDIFMEHHIHPLKRDNYPIVEDAKGNIVWLPNLKKSQFNKTKTEKYDIILKYY